MWQRTVKNCGKMIYPTLNTYSGGAKDTLAYESFLYSGFDGSGLGAWERFALDGYDQPEITNGEGSVDEAVVLDGYDTGVGFVSPSCECVGGVAD